MALSFVVLDALDQPDTAVGLAQRLDVPLAHLERELARLEARGYVERTACAASTCSRCALRATCGDDGAPRWGRRRLA